MKTNEVEEKLTTLCETELDLVSLKEGIQNDIAELNKEKTYINDKIKTKEEELKKLNIRLNKIVMYRKYLKKECVEEKFALWDVAQTMLDKEMVIAIVDRFKELRSNKEYPEIEDTLSE